MDNRWHDDRGYLSVMISMLEQLPDELKGVVVKAIDGRVNWKWERDELLKSLGTEKIMAFHKSKNKSRSYDKVPELHNTINHFFLLPDKEQEDLAEECVQFTKSVVEYIANCQEHHMLPNSAELDEMTKIFISRGFPYVQHYIQDKFPEFKFSESVVADEKGMRVQSQKKPE